MRFRWDSGLARDISNELDRLEEELGDCKEEIDRCATILREMAGSDADGLIEEYISLTAELKKSVAKLEERFGATGRGINRASELFESNEQTLRGRAENMGAGEQTVSEAENVAWSGTAPIFYNIPGMATVPPIGENEPPRHVVWTPLAGISQTVIIDQILPGGMLTPPWFQVIIDSDNEQRRYH